MVGAALCSTLIVLFKPNRGCVFAFHKMYRSRACLTGVQRVIISQIASKLPPVTLDEQKEPQRQTFSTRYPHKPPSVYVFSALVDEPPASAELTLSNAPANSSLPRARCALSASRVLFSRDRFRTFDFGGFEHCDLQTLQSIIPPSRVSLSTLQGLPFLIFLAPFFHFGVRPTD